MKLIVISSPVCFAGEARVINQLFDGGMEILHLRKPAADITVYAKLMEEIAVEYRDRLALHDHHELAPSFGTKRLHYPESLRSVQTSNFGQRRNENCILSTAIHQVEHLESVQDFNYTFLSPVFDSVSKIGYKGIFNDDFILHKKKQKPAAGVNEVIALGGVRIDNVWRIKKMGFDGVALLGWIWEDPQKALINLKQIKCWIKENT